MSFEDGIDHSGSNPQFALPGDRTNPKAQVANARLSPNGQTIILATRSTGGDGTQTEDDLYVGVKGRQSGNVNKSAKAASVNKSAAVQTGQPAGVTIPDHGDWAAFVQVKGKNFASATSVRAFWYPNDDDTKAPLMEQTATYRGHEGTDEITIQIPGDPSRSGWSGDFANGVLRIYLIMPGQKQMLFAAKYTVGSMPATASTALATGTTEPTPVSGTSQGARSEGGETTSSTSAISKSKGKKPSGTIRIRPLKKAKEMVAMTGGAATPDTVHPVSGTPQGAQMAGTEPSPESSGTEPAPGTKQTNTTKVQDEVTESKSFALAAGERTGWPIVIGNPGPINVQVDTKGGPVVVTLVHPDGRSEQQSGSGSVRLQGDATPADVSKGMLWTVGVHPAATARTRSLSVVRSAVDAASVIAASGSVSISHPPGDLRRAEVETVQRSQTIGRQDMASSIAARNTGSQELQIVDAGSGLVTQQAQQLERLRSQFAQMQKSSSSAASTAAAITQLSISEGRPGDPVLVHGTGFGEQQGSVTFSVEPNSALAAQVVIWSNTAILVNVPDVSGMAQPYDGELQVNGTVTVSAPFRFIPATETRVLAPQFEQMTLDNPSALAGNVCHPACAMGASLDLLMGHRGDDSFFRTMTLKNGWKVYQVYLVHVQGNDDLQGPWIDGSADASITEARVGTNSPFVRVHWWHDAFGFIAYLPHIVIAGPKGVPYQ